MKLFAKPPVYACYGSKPLTDPELCAAMAVPEEQPQWRAVMQMILQLETQANLDAQRSVNHPGVSASCNGGAEWLGRLRVELMAARATGFSGRRMVE